MNDDAVALKKTERYSINLSPSSGAVERPYVIYWRTGNGFERYWDGTFSDLGEPIDASSPFFALRFRSARAAYEHAGQFKCLEYWRVGAR